MEIIKWNIEILRFSKRLLNYDGIKYASSLCRNNQVLSTLCIQQDRFVKPYAPSSNRNWKTIFSRRIKWLAFKVIIL